MTTSQVCQYKLVPAVAPSEDRFHPTSFFPAIPIRFGADWTRVVYARLDVAQSVSVVDASLAINIAFDFSPLDQGRKVDVVVLRPDHSPWMQVDAVPFELRPPDPLHEEATGVTLGYESFLSALKLAFDFPRRTFTISAPQRFLLPRPRRSGEQFPNSILEAERLIALGSYSSAVASLLSGIEQALPPTADLPSTYSSSSSAGLSRTVASITGDLELSSLVLVVSQLRNRAVHGTHMEQPTKEEAEEALKASKKVIRAISRSA
jgi:hypothetical protein